MLAVIPLIVLVNGLPGSGKSTLARALAARFDRAAVVAGDYLQHEMTVSGLVGPDEEPVDEATRQLALRWRNIAALASHFHDDDFTVVVDSLVVPHLLDGFRAATAGRPLAYLHLCPDRAIGLARDAARGDRSVGDRYDWVEAQFGPLRGLGVWIDNAHQSIDETTDAAYRAIASGAALLAEGALRPHDRLSQRANAKSASRSRCSSQASASVSIICSRA